MKPRFQLGLALVVLTSLAWASDLAVLHNGFSIRHERREVVGFSTRLFLSSDTSYVDIPTEQIDHFETDLSLPTQSAQPALHQSSLNLTDVVNAAGDRHHIDPDFITSVIHAESGFNVHAVSPKGAQGLMQLMPQTASQLGVTNSFDPDANVEAGTHYLRELLERYHFDMVKALAAYNAGPQRVTQYRGLPPYYETRAYVARVVRDFNQKKLAERKAAATKTSNSAQHKHPAVTVKQAAASTPSQSAVR